MTAKEYLSRARSADRRINAKNRELHGLRLNVAQMGAQSNSERVQRSSSGDGMKIVDKIIDLQNEINGEIDALVELKKEIRGKINQLGDERYITVLTDYYINCMTWEQVAISSYFDLRYVYKLHGRALQSFRDKFGMN